MMAPEQLVDRFYRAAMCRLMVRLDRKTITEAGFHTAHGGDWDYVGRG